MTRHRARPRLKVATRGTAPPGPTEEDRSVPEARSLLSWPVLRQLAGRDILTWDPSESKRRPDSGLGARRTLFIVCLALGVGGVIIRALVSDHLRGREDVSFALGTPE